MANGSSAQFDALTAVEYSTLRVPYETLNRKFRHIQKGLERATFRFTRDHEGSLRRKLKDGGGKMNAKEILPALTSTVAFLEEAVQMASSALDDEIALIDEMMTRISFLQCGPSLSESEEDTRQLWDVKRCDRMVAEQLLRFGFVASARALAKESGIEPLVDVEPYEKACTVIHALRRRQTAPLHEWINEHRSRLKRVPSKLEISVWVQEAVECVRNDDRKGALAIVRKHVLPEREERKGKRSKSRGGGGAPAGATAAAAAEVDADGDVEMREEGELAAGAAATTSTARTSRSADAEIPKKLKQISGLICCGRTTTHPEFAAMLSDDRWKELVNMFREDFAGLYQLPEHTAFSVALQVGIAAHKTPWCQPDGNAIRKVARQKAAAAKAAEKQKLIAEGKIKWTPFLEAEEEERVYAEEKARAKKDDCPCCEPTAYQLSIGLPYAHVSTSKLLCAYTREICNEDNQPYQLPSGYVYGQKGLTMLERANDQYLCPRTTNLYPRTAAVRLYIL